MKRHLKFLTLPFLYLCCLTATSQSGDLKRLENDLNKQPQSFKAYQKLQEWIADKNNVSTFQDRERLRQLFQRYGQWSAATTYAENESGGKIELKCHVKNENGQSVPNAAIHVYQTDANGFYSVTDATTGKMGENDARLFAYVQTDAAGNVTLKTIRPASYPRQYKGRTIPQHVHFDINAEGYTPLKIQMVFDDDPAMDEHWRAWAAELGYPVVVVSQGKGGFDIIVKK